MGSFQVRPDGTEKAKSVRLVLGSDVDVLAFLASLAHDLDAYGGRDNGVDAASSTIRRM